MAGVVNLLCFFCVRSLVMPCHAMSLCVFVCVRVCVVFWCHCHREIDQLSQFVLPNFFFLVFWSTTHPIKYFLSPPTDGHVYPDPYPVMDERVGDYVFLIDRHTHGRHRLTTSKTTDDEQASKQASKSKGETKKWKKNQASKRKQRRRQSTTLAL